jgi:polyhydroxyalkanoate synthesis regulator phasin
MNQVTRIAFLAAIMLGAAFSALAHREESIEELKARVAAAKPEDQPKLCIEIARRDVETANTLYGDGRVDEARAAVSEALMYSQKGADAAIQTGKKLKATEIGIRKMAQRLEDIKRTLNFEDQAPVQAAVDRMQELRTALLKKMFGKENKD